jgi:hypothetical protein
MSSVKAILYKSGKICLLSWCILALTAYAPITREYQVKAVLLFNFTQFIEWPTEAYSTSKAPLEISILGHDPFGSYLDQIIAGESANGHPLIVKRYNSAEDVQSSQILFIGKSEAENLEKIIQVLKGKKILLVGEVPDFIQRGGAIRFVTVANNVKFQINPEAAKAEGITISSKLLRLAEIVTPK